MAYDYIKSVLKSKNPKELLTHPLLEFKRELNERTGELSERKIATYKKMKFIIDKRRVFIEGSLHYYHNNGEHNHNDFTLDMVNHVLNELEVVFGIDLSTSKIENIEVGVNLKVNYKTSLILDNLIFHGGIKFKDVKVNRSKADYREATHERYRVKAYDKAIQFNLPYELFRFEIHYNRMIDLKKHGIVYLSNLKEKNKLERLKKELIKKWREIFIYDWTIQKEMPKNKKPKDFSCWSLTNYWLGLNKSNRNKRRTVYKKIVSKYSDGVQGIIEGLIESKMSELIYGKGDFLTEGVKNKKSDLLTV